MPTVRRATIEDLNQLAQLFDGYRQFYEQVPDIALANTFIADRTNKHESVIFVAAKNETNSAEKQLIGFCQIYPSSAR